MSARPSFLPTPARGNQKNWTPARGNQEKTTKRQCDDLLCRNVTEALEREKAEAFGLHHYLLESKPSGLGAFKS
jgi:hypothetical protein